MTDRGRHARRSGVGFYREAGLLVAGIVVVGVLVFGGLSWWAGRDDGDVPTPVSRDSTTTATGFSTTTAGASSTTTNPPTTLPTVPSTTTTTSPPTTLRAARPPSEVRVVVLNSIGVAGLAGDLSDELAGLGYQVAEPDNYTPELSDTMIFHADGFSLEALEVAEAVPDGTVAPDQELATDWGVDVVVVIGRSYQE